MTQKIEEAIKKLVEEFNKEFPKFQMFGDVWTEEVAEDIFKFIFSHLSRFYQAGIKDGAKEYQAIIEQKIKSSKSWEDLLTLLKTK